MTMEMNYVFWTEQDVDHGCRLRALQGYDDDWKLHEGIALGEEWPSDAHFDMNPNFPDDTLVPDFVKNISSFFVVSTRVKEHLESKGLDNIEFLSVTVRDLKGKAVRPPCFIVNVIGTVPLLRIDDCGVTWDEMDDTVIGSMKRFEVDPEALANAPPIFRIQSLSRHLMIRKDLAKGLDAAGFKGQRWITPTAIVNSDAMGYLGELPKQATAAL
jgi:hypothetical protein